MPRLGRALYLVARRAATVPASTMPALAPSFPLISVASLSSSFVDSNVGALSVVGKKPLNVPHLDVIARCSSADPATSPSWDIYAEKSLTSRFFKDLVCDSPAVYGRPQKNALSRASNGRFSSHAKVCVANDSRSYAAVGDGREATEIIGEAEDAEGVEGESTVMNSSTDEGALREGGAPSGMVENEVEGETPGEKARGERRRRGSVDGNSGSSPPEWRDLLTVPGIGRRNMEKLVAKGIARLDELKQLYRDKYRSDGTEKMVEFLRSSVGVQKHHATSISVFLKNTVDAEEDRTAESGAKSKKRLTFCVEGNISVGKTTFLHRIANETIELRDLVEVVPEPIGKWQDVGPDHFNILDAFYGDPERYAYTFQNYVFVTRMMQERESAKGDKRLRLMERSVFSDRMVFVRAVHEAKWMSDAEISIYDSWFDPVVSAMPGLVPDAFIYLRATPDTCLRRLQSRNREEETNVTLDYLRGLHEKHEQWLFPTERKGSNVVSVSEWPSANKGPLSPRLQDRVLYLEGENVHSSIQKVPALVLDCEPSIDFTRDVEAKAEYARQVADFFEYVQGLKDSAGASADSGSLILPRGGLLGPDGNLLQPNSLEGVNLRRHISTVCG
ncbi:unnamed protein product [Calypogeia fissa]